jgi:hypothetical protein
MGNGGDGHVVMWRARLHVCMCMCREGGGGCVAGVLTVHQPW